MTIKNSNLFDVKVEGFMKSDPHNIQYGASVGFGGGWSCCPFGNTLNTKAKDAAVVFDTGQYHMFVNLH